jgi:hypothetical protein
VLFILSNLGYIFVAHLQSVTPQRINPIVSSLGSFCSATTPYNHIIVLLLGTISAIFHSSQCFLCTHKQRQATVIFNTVDLNCAMAYSLYLAVCFLKRQTLYALPCFAFLIGGGVFKLNGYYNVYFLLHGLWHVSIAWYMLEIVCV